MKPFEQYNLHDSLITSYANAVSAGFWLNSFDWHEEDDFIKYMPEIESSISIRLEKDIEALDRLYLLKDIHELKKFLSDHTSIVFELIKAHKYIEEIFSPEYKPILEACFDQEESYKGIFITININMPPEKSVELLQMLDEKWISKLNDPEAKELVGIDIINK
jgi:hypothetical protein